MQMKKLRALKETALEKDPASWKLMMRTVKDKKNNVWSIV